MIVCSNLFNSKKAVTLLVNYNAELFIDYKNKESYINYKGKGKNIPYNMAIDLIELKFRDSKLFELDCGNIETRCQYYRFNTDCITLYKEPLDRTDLKALFIFKIITKYDSSNLSIIKKDFKSIKNQKRNKN
jgi:hypothetical protein